MGLTCVYERLVVQERYLFKDEKALLEYISTLKKQIKHHVLPPHGFNAIKSNFHEMRALRNQ